MSFKAGTIDGCRTVLWTTELTISSSYAYIIGILIVINLQKWVWLSYTVQHYCWVSVWNSDNLHYYSSYYNTTYANFIVNVAIKLDFPFVNWETK